MLAQLRGKIFISVLLGGPHRRPRSRNCTASATSRRSSGWGVAWPTGWRTPTSGVSCTATYVGGGAILGAIIGAVAGGGKGAAIGAATGAGAGAATQIIVKGRSVNVPAESLVTFRLAEAFSVPVADTGFQRNGRHYHRY